LQDIQASLRDPGTSLRVDGLPGHGKSRLCIEALRPLEDAGRGVVYIDAAFASEADIVDALLGWKRMEAVGIVVVDNCIDQLHHMLSGIVAGSRLNVVTIDYGLAEMGPTPMIRLDRSEDEIISGILTEAYGERLTAPDFARIVDFAFGSPRMARLLAENNLDVVPGGLHTLTNDDLLRRLLFGHDAPNDNAEKAIRGLSLFEHVGCEGTVKDHLRYVRENFGAGIGEFDFSIAVGRFSERGILVRIGDFYRVSPPPMAVRLAKMWLDYSDEDARGRLFAADMPPRLVEQLCNQFRYLGTVPRAAEIAAQLCGATAPFGTAEVLKTKRGARIFRSLAEVNREAGAAALTRELGTATRDQLLSIVDGRRDLIFALERLIFNRHLFLEAGRVLVHLADAENEQISNNATGVLVEKYSPWLGGTEAPPNLRFELLDEFAGQSESYGLLAVKCLAGALKPQFAHRVIGPEYQGGRPRLVDWKPETQRELLEYMSAAVDRLMALSERGGPLTDSSRAAFAGSIRTLVAYGRLDDLRRAIAVMRPSAEPWVEAIDSLRAAQAFEAKDNKGLTADLESILSSLAPRELKNRLKLLVTEAPSDFRPQNGGNLVDLAEQRTIELAQEVVANCAVEEALAYVVEGKQTRGFDFGAALASSTNNLADLLTIVIGATRAANSSLMNPSVLGGALSVAARANRGIFESFIALLVRDSEIKKFVPWFLAISSPTNDDILRVIPLVRDPHVEPVRFKNLAWGRALDSIDDEIVAKLISELIEVNGADVAIHIAEMRLVSNPADKSKLAPILERAFMRWNYVDTKLSTFEDHGAADLLESLLMERGHEELAAAITHQVLEKVGRSDVSFNDRSRAAKLWPPLFEYYASTVWPIVMRALSQATPERRMYTQFSFEYIPAGKASHELSLLQLPMEMLLEWCEIEPSSIPAYLAQKIPLYSIQDNNIETSPLLSVLLDRFGDQQAVLSGIYANLFSFGSTGSRVPYLQERLRFIESLPDFGHSEIAKWKIDVRHGLVESIAEARRRDEEFRSGIF
jgi:hypothetical protein